MNRGRVEQLDEPFEDLRLSENAFVADFMASASVRRPGDHEDGASSPST
jgi:hypothetical protein